MENLIPVHEDKTNQAKRTLLEDPRLVDDLESGLYFDDDNYLDSLPRDTKVLLIAVQLTPGDNRPQFCLNRSSQSLTKFERTRTSADLDDAIAFGALCLRHIPPDHTSRPAANWQLARTLQRAWEKHDTRMNLDQCIRHYHKAVATAPPGFVSLPPWLCDVYVMLRKRYQLDPTPDDLREALFAIDRSIELSSTNPFQAVFLNNKAGFLLYIADQDPNDYDRLLREAAECFDRVVDMCDRYIDQGTNRPPLAYDELYRSAANCQIRLYRSTKVEEHSSKAIDLVKKPRSFYEPESESLDRINSALCSAFVARSEVLNLPVSQDPVWKPFVQSEPDNVGIRAKVAMYYNGKASAEADLGNEAIADTYVEMGRTVIADVSPTTHSVGHSHLDHFFFAFGSLLYTKYRILGLRQNIDLAVQLYDLAIKVSKKPFNYHFSFTEILLDRYQSFLEPHDIKAALYHAKAALESCPPEEKETLGECNRAYGRALNMYSNTNSTLENCRMAISMLTSAMKLITRENSALPLALNDLGIAHVHLHAFENARDNLDKAIASYFLALEILREHLPQRSSAAFDISMLYNSLGLAMLRRYLAFSSEVDLKSSMKYFENAYGSLDPSHPMFSSRLANFCYASWLSFQLSGDKSIVTHADREIQRALAAAIILPPNRINSLKTHRGSMALTLYSNTSDESDLNTAISHFEDALKTEGLLPIQEAITTMDLAIALESKAKIDQKPLDFDEVFHKYERAKELVSLSDSLYWTIKYNQARLGDYVNQEYKSDWSIWYGTMALEYYTELVDMLSVSTNKRLRCAEAVARLSYELGKFVDARVYESKALELLPSAISGSFTRPEQLRLIKRYHQIPGTVTAFSLAAGDSAYDAVHRLEAGRAFLWDRLLIQQTPIEQLSKDYPDLSTEFQATRAALTHSSDSQPRRQSALSQTLNFESTDGSRLDRERKWQKLEKIIQNIRDKPGFKSFMKLPDTPSSLQQYASNASIIYINATIYRSDALILTPDQIYNVHLPNFAMEDIKTKGAEMLWVKDALGQKEERAGAFAKFETIRTWLWDVCTWPVLESMNITHKLPETSTKPRVIWVTNGWISLFPFHAAGDFGPDANKKDPSCVHDLVISSYTASLKALNYARERSATLKLKQTSLTDSTYRKKILLVAMETTPGESDLPQAIPEVRSVAADLSQSMNCNIKIHPDASSVKKELHTSNIAYFACHSKADKTDPSQSAILLAGPDNIPTKFSVRSILATKMDDCELVYSSSCESGANKDLLLSNEGLSIAGAFHMAGVPQVVSGMWQIEDNVAREVAVEFFRELRDGNDEGRLNVDRAARALHRSVQVQRDRGTHPVLWGGVYTLWMLREKSC
ncbi:hypothetical protein MMC10_006292 [Thelotrema lepadinum]|nr:hypothetical protein [Thelotrema lepadinum]